MGHLVSARAFRLGWTFGWSDSWFVAHKSDYAYYLFLCFRLRHFLLSYFYSKKRDKSSYIYSHFNIVRKLRMIIIKIFFYDATFEESRRLFLPKILKYIRKSFDEYIFRKKFINNNSLGVLLDSQLYNKRHLWLRNYLVTKRKFNLSLNNVSNSNINKSKFILDNFDSIFNSLVSVWLIRFVNNSKIFNNLQKIRNFSNQKFFSKFCFNKLIKSNFWNKKLLSIILKQNHSYNDILDVIRFFNDYSVDIDVVDRWSNIQSIVPFQDLNTFDNKRRQLFFRDFLSSFKWSFFYIFNKYMMRYYMSLSFNYIKWTNWRNLNNSVSSSKSLNYLSGKLNKSINNSKLNQSTLLFKDWFNSFSPLTKSIKDNIIVNNNIIGKTIHRRNFLNKNKKHSDLIKLSSNSIIIFSLVFASYFGVFRFNTAYDWRYWSYLVKSLSKKDFSSIYKYFSYRSLFTNIPYKTNMAQLSALLGFFGTLKGYIYAKRVNFFISEFIQNLFLIISTGSYISVIWLCLYYKIKFFVFDHNILPQYFIISNNTINSIFLSRYIAKMLDYNNTLRGTLNPVKREFFQLVKRTSFKFDVDRFVLGKKQNNFYKIIFRYILSVLFLMYDSFLLKYFDNQAIYFTVDMFLVYMWFYNNNLSHISKLSKSFSINRSAFVCLFIQNLNVKYSSQFYKLLFQNVSNTVNPLLEIQNLFDYIFSDFYLNKSALFLGKVSVSIPSNIKLMRLSLVHFSNFMKMQYNYFNYYSLSQTTSLNI